MGRRPKRLDPGEPLHAFAAELRRLRDQAGSSGTMIQTCKSGAISRTTYYAWLEGRQLPGRDALERIVRGWGGNVAEWAEKRRSTEELLINLGNHARLVPDFESANVLRPRIIEQEYVDIARLRIKRTAEASTILVALGYDPERATDMAAYTFLAMCNVGLKSDWNRAERPLVQLRGIIDWIRDEYAHEYSTNTRESIRRTVLQQLIEKGIVEFNPDDPFRPVNSVHSCYRIASSVEYVINAFGSEDFIGYAKEWRRRFTKINSE
ncbi:helix-turn-helix domain-containing protein [Nocardia sp. NPDC059240]|uniref:helix-turn-helix domain-containing protein n=1 Tax=Nocardia sp. NPDC059240 TaxID=3346786 RepID=UPI00369F4BBB